jgi:hypothetical protein
MEQVNLGWPIQRRIDQHVAAPVQVEMVEGKLDELLDAVRLPRAEDEVGWGIVSRRNLPS